MHCIKCGTTMNLMMLPNRNALCEMVGWHFVCPECLPFIAGKETRTEFGNEEINKKDIH